MISSSRVRTYSFIFLSCLTVFSLGFTTVFATKGSYPGANGMIAFVDWVEGGRSEIFIMNNDGTSIVRLTYNETLDKDPCWSPDGQWIAFVNSDGIQRYEIWAIRADGTGLRQVTTPPDGSSDHTPAWSPDGKTILFRRYNSSYSFNIHKIDAESTGVGVKLIEDADFPCWSPDGSMIAYVNMTDNRIWVADSSTGTPLFRVTSSESSHPCWSPDGMRIVYEKGDEVSEIWVIDIDGNNDQQVTNPPREVGDENPNWSPDGKKIMFDRKSDSLWLVNPNGTDAYDFTPSMPGAREGDWAIEIEPPETPVGGMLLPYTSATIITMITSMVAIIVFATGLLFKKQRST